MTDAPTSAIVQRRPLRLEKKALLAAFAPYHHRISAGMQGYAKAEQAFMQSGALREQNIWSRLARKLALELPALSVDPLLAFMGPENTVRRDAPPGPSIELLARPLLNDIVNARLQPQSLINAASFIRQSPVAIRVAEALTECDGAGRQVQFLTATSVREVLSDLCEQLNSANRSELAALGIWSWVAMTNVHAFEDGNGRLARALSAACLSAHMQPPLFAPFSILNHVCSGAVVLAQRRAELHGDWEPLFKLIAGFLEIMAATVEAEVGETSVSSTFSIPDRAFPLGIDLSCPKNAAPFIRSWEWVMTSLGHTPRRASLLHDLLACIAWHRANGRRVSFMMVGGSFLDAQREPQDLDALLYYSADTTSGFNSIQCDEHARWPSLDLRHCPIDGPPVVVAKTSAFFALLYSQDRRRGEPKAMMIVTPPDDVGTF